MKWKRSLRVLEAQSDDAADVSETVVLLNEHGEGDDETEINLGDGDEEEMAHKDDNEENNHEPPSL